MSEHEPALPPLPAAPVDRVVRPLERFLHVEATSGIVLLVATAIALIAANGPFAAAWDRFWHLRVHVGIGRFAIDETLQHWVNDALMTIFFFVIGLEIKRELVAGELAEPRKLVLPLVAATGGAAVPALLFLALRGGTDDARGWAVPMATDIAFVVGTLALLGPRVPRGLKVFVMSLAIVDDLFAVIVIAVVFTGSIQLGWLGGAVAGFVLVEAFKRAGVRNVGVYVLVGVAIWVCTLESGSHPTVAGALLGLMTPAIAWVEPDVSRGVLASAAGRESIGAKTAANLAFAVRESVAPLDRLVIALHPWVSFGIMPVFALANAGVPIAPRSLLDALPVAVAVGLVVGKPLGIFVASWLAARAGWARLPEGVSLGALLGAGFLCGIGFTMAIFVASLAFGGEALVAAKSGVLAGSFVSAVIGALVLRGALPRGGGSDDRSPG